MHYFIIYWYKVDIFRITVVEFSGKSIELYILIWDFNTTKNRLSLNF